MKLHNESLCAETVRHILVNCTGKGVDGHIKMPEKIAT